MAENQHKKIDLKCWMKRKIPKNGSEKNYGKINATKLDVDLYVYCVYVSVGRTSEHTAEIEMCFNLISYRPLATHKLHDISLSQLDTHSSWVCLCLCERVSNGNVRIIVAMRDTGLTLCTYTHGQNSRKKAAASHSFKRDSFSSYIQVGAEQYSTHRKWTLHFSFTFFNVFFSALKYLVGFSFYFDSYRIASTFLSFSLFSRARFLPPSPLCAGIHTASTHTFSH